MKTFQRRLAFAFILGVAGCSTPPADSGRSLIFEVQDRLRTSQQFHQTGSGFEGYLVSSEKVYRREGGWLPTGLSYADARRPGQRQDGHADGPKYFDFSEKTFGAQFNNNQSATARFWAKWILDANTKLNVVTQIVRFDRAGSDDEAWTRRFIYDLYSKDHPRYVGPVHESTMPADSGDRYRDQFEDVLTGSGVALEERLRDDADARLTDANNAGQPFTHLVVISTGWNTALWESVANYADWQIALQHANPPGAPRFRPLFIGVSWASLWPLGAVSFGNKASDADEIGLTWANLLVNGVARPLATHHKIPLIVMGHSFGARMMSRALNSAHALAPVPPHWPNEKPDRVALYVGMEAAFTVNRFISDAGIEGSPYAKSFNEACAQWAFTASRYDSAVRTAPFSWTDGLAHLDFNRGLYLGDPRVRHVIEGKDKPLPFAFTETDAQGHLHDLKSAQEKILLIDASEIISTTPFQVGPTSGAHSDIYDVEMGRLLRELFTEFAMKPAPPKT